MKYLIIIALVLAGCSSKPASNGSTSSATDSTLSNTQDLIVLDITQKPNKTIYIEDIADLEFIQLETNDSNLVSRPLPDLVSENYIVYHNQDGQILVFSRQGKILHSFNHMGGGPEEYQSMLNIVLDENSAELYINDIVKSKIHVYSIDGTFKRHLPLPRRFFPDCLMNYDENHLFCYNSYYMDKPEKGMSEEEISQRDKPYYFISKQTGEITSLEYNIPNRMGNLAYQMKKDGTIGSSSMTNIYPLTRNTPDIMITEFADDTLYSLKDGKLLPVMVKEPSTHKMVPPMMVGVDLFTDRYVLINACDKNFDEKPKSINMAYDKQSNSFNRIDSKDHIIILPLKGNVDLPRNTGISIIYNEYLLEDYKDGKLQGELKEIASRIKEDDNPILMLIKFKE